METVRIPAGNLSGMTVEVSWPALFNTVRVAQTGDLISLNRDQVAQLIEALQKSQQDDA